MFRHPVALYAAGFWITSRYCAVQNDDQKKSPASPGFFLFTMRCAYGFFTGVVVPVLTVLARL